MKAKKIVDKNMSKVSLSVEEKTDSKYITNKLVVDKSSRTIENNNVEFIVPNDVKSVKIVSEFDTEKLKQDFGVSFQNKVSEVVVDLDKIEKVIDAQEPEIISSLDTISLSYPISKVFQCLDDQYNLCSYFFVDNSGVVKNHSIFKRISKNIEQNFQLSLIDFSIERKRVKKDGSYFDTNEPLEFVETNIELVKYFEDDNKTLYKFTDKTIKNKTYGLYSYNLSLTYIDPLVDYLLDILSKMQSDLGVLEVNTLVSSRFPEHSDRIDIQRIINDFNKYEKVYYGFSTRCEITGIEDYWIFVRKYQKLYFHLYSYVHSIAYENLNIHFQKSFKEMFDSDRIEDAGVFISTPKTISEALTIDENKKVLFDKELLEPSSAKLTSKIKLSQNNNSLLKNEDDNGILRDFAYNDNVSTDESAIGILSEINKREIQKSYYEVLVSFDDGVYGDQWLRVYANSIEKLLMLKKDMFLCRKVDTNFSLPIINEYFLINR